MPLPLEKLSRAFHLLGHPTKLKIIQYLMDNDPHGTDPIVPTIIAAELGISLSVVSYSLQQLNRAQIVFRSPSGRYAFYSVNWSFLKQIKEFFNESE